jgi:hypothetical protein
LAVNNCPLETSHTGAELIIIYLFIYYYYYYYEISLGLIPKGWVAGRRLME